MAISKSYKFLSLLMVLVLCFSFVVPQPDAYAELVATGIALGTALIVAGVAYGLVPVMNGYTFQSANDYWESQFSNWANSNGRDVLEFLSDITFANNVLTLGTDSAEAFNSFTSDYVSSNNIGSSSSVLQSPVSTFGGYTVSSVSDPVLYSSIIGSDANGPFSISLSGTRYEYSYIRPDGSSFSSSNSAHKYSGFIVLSSGAICALYPSGSGYSSASTVLTFPSSSSSIQSIYASLSPSFDSNISTPARSISVPADFVSSEGLINPAFPNIGDVVILGDSPGPDEPGDDDDDGTLLGYVHDIAVSLGITGGLFGVVSQVSDAVSNISDYVSDIYDSVSDAISSFGETVGDIADSVSGLFDEAFEWFHDTWSDFLEWLQQLIQDIIDAINAGILDITDAISLVVSKIQSIGFDIVEAIEGLAPAPVPETVPPVPDDIEGIDSDFDLNLPSIWHYVTSWLACIAPFVSVMQSLWAVLPTCVVAPVYASIVLIIVLGLLHKVIHL